MFLMVFKAIQTTEKQKEPVFVTIQVFPENSQRFAHHHPSTRKGGYPKPLAWPLRTSLLDARLRVNDKAHQTLINYLFFKKTGPTACPFCGCSYKKYSILSNLLLRA
ncbi:hypothetical protein RCH06_002073 [Polaromonas sp. CG_9.5]|uniref:hypothetical protein n=1 Tax=Polaromonas sp. CG_9.5 TaxID=3071705 RepID=UPI002E0CF75E|nr:hypothetical protein [Polaromonas sp. CG_9.5]